VVDVLFLQTRGSAELTGGYAAVQGVEDGLIIGKRCSGLFHQKKGWVK
jgi:hypothetical protein